eukprot:scaffold664480_cov47-Prasinocladus_malaysianus.AAC.2
MVLSTSRVSFPSMYSKGDCMAIPGGDRPGFYQADTHKLTYMNGRQLSWHMHVLNMLTGQSELTMVPSVTPPTSR